MGYQDAAANIVVAPVDGSEPPRVRLSGANLIPCDWSVDGDMIFMNLMHGSRPSLDVLSPGEQKLTTVVKVGAEAQFSPDGKWIAYVGIGPTSQVVIQRFSHPGARIQISTMPGSVNPRWSLDGKKIYFLQPDRKLVMVSFDGANNSATPPEVFAQTRVTRTLFAGFQYAVAADGRVLVNSLPVSNSSPLTLIVNWDKELKNR